MQKDNKYYFVKMCSLPDSTLFIFECNVCSDGGYLDINEFCDCARGISFRAKHEKEQEFEEYKYTTGEIVNNIIRFHFLPFSVIDEIYVKLFEEYADENLIDMIIEYHNRHV